MFVVLVVCRMIGCRNISRLVFMCVLFFEWNNVFRMGMLFRFGIFCLLFW